MKPEITNNLALIRKQLGISASELAQIVGATRQTIYSVEAGTYVPNTALGLRLARALGVGFEELFTLAQPDSKAQHVHLLPSSGTLHNGQCLQLCRIDEKLFGVPASPAGSFLPASDGAIADRPTVNGKAKVLLNNPQERFENRLLLAGCDPAMSLLARCLQPAGFELMLLHRNSSESLALLKQGCVHLAGTHLRDEASGQSNLPAINKLFARTPLAVVSFALGEEGLVTAAGNPKKMKGVQDLGRNDVTMVNRELGSGSRSHLDALLGRYKLNSKSVRGYDRTVPGHLAAAWEVKSGTADCCIATESAARAFGLHFIALESVRYDLAVHQRHLNLPAVQALFNTLNRSDFKRGLERVGGYQTSVTGARIR